LASKEAPLKEGDKAYVVSRTWVDKALASGANTKQAQKDLNPDAELGPVDNSDVVEEVFKDSSGIDFTRLKIGSGLESFELFPEDAWNMVADWYGLADGQHPISRSAINDAPDAQSKANILYELHPPVFRIHRLWSELSPLPIEQALKAQNPPPLLLVRSRKTGAQAFLKDVKRLAGIPLERKVRMFSIPPQVPASNLPDGGSALTPPDSPQTGSNDQVSSVWPHLLVDIKSFSETRDIRRDVSLTDHTNNDKYNGKSTIQHWDLVTDQTLVLDEAIDDSWVSTYTGRRMAKTQTKHTPSALTSKPTSGRNSPAPQGPNTRGRALRKRIGNNLGAVGLHNLGNTCYMNSALQCVRSVEELTKYFLTDSYEDEINKTNPLGYHGRVAMAYMGLLKEIYNDGRGSVSPRDFKTTVGRCRSTFQGWGQQDSQEFLGFLLDGLQEDLSRIKKKPYIEKPDSTDDMINDPEAIRKMAEEVWDITRRRDDSVIADLFTGMYKSTLKCPECGKISITFDPFNNLTLPLPVEDLWTHTVKFFPLNDAPVRLEVELPKHSAIELLKQFISERTGVPVPRLMGAEEFKDRFFKIYHNQNDVSEEIQPSDHPTFHELEATPTNWPVKGKWKKYRSMLDVDSSLDEEWDDPKYERMVIPVFHRRAPGSGVGHSRDGAAPPHFIVLARTEACNYDRIAQKVLEKVATFSTWSALAEEPGADSIRGPESDTVIVPLDLDSSGESRVAARSVEDEEDLVDVTMKDDSEQSTSKASSLPQSSKVLKNFNKTRPAFVNSDGFLDPRFQNLFDLSYFTDGSDGVVPTGWSQVDQNRTLPKLRDRMPRASVEEEEEDQTSPESWGSMASGHEESSNDEESKSNAAQTRMLDESSEEGNSPPPVRTMLRPRFSLMR
jgi:ubiquitin carboxyl-terminal hydrolase 4/11